jgi:hypothetical protein
MEGYKRTFSLFHTSTYHKVQHSFHLKFRTLLMADQLLRYLYKKLGNNINIFLLCDGMHDCYNLCFKIDSYFMSLITIKLLSGVSVVINKMKAKN